MAFIRQNDLLFAYMALTLVAGLSGNDRRVAGAILDHFNKKTGQCDPSGEGLAARLGIDRKTVVTATARLCGEFGFFRKVSHGGYAHRASYAPQWAQFRKVVEDWNAKRRGEEQASNEAKTPHSVRRNDLIEWGENASQTDRINRSNKPIETDGACGNGAPGPEPSASEPQENPHHQARSETLNGLLKQSVRRASGNRSPSHADAARQRAEGRIETDLRSLGLHAHAEAIERMDEATHADAAEAEMRRRGAGLALIRERLHLPGGRGPPGGGSKV